mgnify:CR=1 FL=1
MRRKLGQINTVLKIYTLQKKDQFQDWCADNWVQTILIIAFGMLIYNKDLNFSIDMNGIQIASFSAASVDQSIKKPTTKKTSFTILGDDLPRAVLAGLKNENQKPAQPVKPKITWGDNRNLANTYSNMTYSVADFATKETSSEFKTKRKKQSEYIKRFAHVAQAEMEKYGIPASITLAQGLLESNVGESRLAVKNNNHFGMKCFSKSCKKGHCSNYTDDSHKDFFRIYQTAWDSYRAHSRMLTGKRYRHLLKLPKTDYKNWSHGLKKAGYATDKHYARKLINLIESLKLYEFDK